MPESLRPRGVSLPPHMRPATVVPTAVRLAPEPAASTTPTKSHPKTAPSPKAFTSKDWTAGVSKREYYPCGRNADVLSVGFCATWVTRTRSWLSAGVGTETDCLTSLCAASPSWRTTSASHELGAILSILRTTFQACFAYRRWIQSSGPANAALRKGIAQLMIYLVRWHVLLIAPHITNSTRSQPRILLLGHRQTLHAGVVR